MNKCHYVRPVVYSGTIQLSDCISRLRLQCRDCFPVMVGPFKEGVGAKQGWEEEEEREERE